MKTHIKQRIVFALIMGVVTTGSISFTLIAYNLGFTPQFMTTWFTSWIVAYSLVIPIILIMGPVIQNLVHRFINGGIDK